jgi:hypothetical protein
MLYSEIIVGILDVKISIIVVKSNSTWTSLGRPYTSKIVIIIDNEKVETGYAFTSSNIKDVIDNAKDVVYKCDFMYHPYIFGIIEKYFPHKMKHIQYVCTKMLDRRYCYVR